MYHWIKLYRCWLIRTALKCIFKPDRTFFDRKCNKNQGSFLFNQNVRTFLKRAQMVLKFPWKAIKKSENCSRNFRNVKHSTKKSRNSSKEINCTINLITVKNCHFKASGAALFSGNKMVLYSSLEFSTYTNRTFGITDGNCRNCMHWINVLPLFFSFATKLKSLFAWAILTIELIAVNSSN